MYMAKNREFKIPMRFDPAFQKYQPDLKIFPKKKLNRKYMNHILSKLIFYLTLLIAGVSMLIIFLNKLDI